MTDEPNNNTKPQEGTPLNFTSKLEWALYHASQGWKVFPLHHMMDGETCSCGNTGDCATKESSRAKHPLFSGGVHSATSDPAVITLWWKSNPEANIGGTRGDVIRVDLDRHPGRPDGVAAWESIAGVNGSSQTRTHGTPSNGLHKFYAIPPDSPKYKNNRGKLPEGIDIQVDTSFYVVLPGSVKNDTGWTLVDDSPIAQAPGWLLSKLVVDDGSPDADPMFKEDLPKLNLSQWRLGQRVTTLIFEPREVGERSDADYAVVARLVEVGAADDEIRSVFKHYPIGQRGKYAERGDKYLATTIKNARRSRAEQEPPMPEDPPGEAKASQRAHGEVFNFLDALEPIPPTDWLVSKFIAPGTLGVISGDPGAGKTYLSMSVTCHVGAGLVWLGRPVVQAPVLFVDEESGPKRFKRRLGAVIRGMGEIPDKLAGRVISLPRFDLLHKPQAVALLRAHIEETGAKLVVFDALVDLMVGGDENAVKDIQPVFQRLREIASDMGVAVLVIHHTGKNGDTRGSSAIEGAVDYLLIVEKRDSQDKHTLEMVIWSKKSRDTEPYRFGVQAEFETDDAGDATRVTFSELDAASIKPGQKFTDGERFVLGYLLVNGPSLKADIVGSADICSSEAARQGIYKLVGKDFVRRTDEGGRGSKAEYALTKKGEAVCTVSFE